MDSGASMSSEAVDIRATLWRLVAEIREGELEPEAAEQAISALDSLIDLQRLEAHGPGRERAASEETAEQATKGVPP